MSLSAGFLATVGLVMTFLPQELLAHFEAPANATAALLIQVFGSAYLGLAILNWMNRGNRIGGIYFRPVSMANFFNFAIGAVPLVKAAISEDFALEIAVPAVAFSVFAIWFALVVFTSTVREN